MENPRVLVVTDRLTPDYGWGRYAVGLLRALRDDGCDVRILSPRSLGTEEDLRSHAHHGTVTSYVRETRRLSRLVASNVATIARASRDCDVVHCLVEPYAVPAAIAGLLVRRPLLVTIHGTYAVRPFRRPGARWWYEFAYRRADRLIAVSNYTRARLPARFTGKVRVVPEGVEHEAFATVPGAIGHAWRPGADTSPYLLSVGPVKRRNGYATTLEAFARVRARFPTLEYRIAGGTDDPAFLAELQSRISYLGLEGAVHLMGRVADDELLALYHGCELFWLLPEDDGEQFHGFGLVYWEANACGKVVIGARDSGAGDAIAPGTNGLLVDSGDATGAAAAAIGLLGERDRLMAMGEAARTHVRPWRDAARLMRDHYADVLRSPLPNKSVHPPSSGGRFAPYTAPVATGQGLPTQPRPPRRGREEERRHATPRPETEGEERAFGGTTKQARGGS